MSKNILPRVEVSPQVYAGGAIGTMMITVTSANLLAKADLVNGDWFEFTLDTPWGQTLVLASGSAIVNSPAKLLQPADFSVAANAGQRLVRIEYIGKGALFRSGEGFGCVLRFLAPPAYAFGSVTAKSLVRAGRLDAVTPDVTTVSFAGATSGTGKGDQPPVKTDGGPKTGGGVTVVNGGTTTVSGGNTTVNGGHTQVNNGLTSVTGGSTQVSGGVTAISGGITNITGGNTTVSGGNTSVTGGQVSAGAGTVVNVGAGAVLNIAAGPGGGALASGPNFLQVAAARWYEAASVHRLTLAARASAMAFDGRHVWAALAQSSKLARIDPSSGEVTEVMLASLSPVQPAPTLIGTGGLIYDGEKFWVATDQGCFAVRRDGSLPLRAAAGGVNGPALFDGESVWVMNSNNLQKVSAVTGNITDSVWLSLPPEGVAFDGKRVWAVTGENGGSLFGARVSDAQIECQQVLGFHPGAIAYDGANLWILDPAGNTVQRWTYDAVTNTCVAAGRYGVGRGPRTLLFDGAFIWVANWLESTVVKLRASDGAQLGSTATTLRPQALAFDGISTWVACEQGVVQRL